MSMEHLVFIFVKSIRYIMMERSVINNPTVYEYVISKVMYPTLSNPQIKQTQKRARRFVLT